MSSSLPTLRWGIVGCGQISAYFASDLVGSAQRPDAPTHHIVQAVGSSSISKGESFVKKSCVAQENEPRIYDTYSGVYTDPDVEVVYIGTPHAYHRQNALDAIAAGKHVVCEKPFTMNVAEAIEVFEAAKNKGVYIMEALWTRFFPLSKKFEALLHEEKAIGDVRRIFVDFSLPMPIANVDPSSRLGSKALGAGVLLDVGVYSLLWASLALDAPGSKSKPDITSKMLFGRAGDTGESIDEAVAVVLSYPETSSQAIATASLNHKTRQDFAVVEGTKGSITVGGVAASRPDYLIVKIDGEEGDKRLDFDIMGVGLYWEQDAVAEDLRAGRKESGTCPISSTVTLLSRADEIRRQNGLVYEADKRE